MHGHPVASSGSAARRRDATPPQQRPAPSQLLEVLLQLLALLGEVSKCPALRCTAPCAAPVDADGAIVVVWLSAVHGAVRWRHALSFNSQSTNRSALCRLLPACLQCYAQLCGHTAAAEAVLMDMQKALAWLRAR